MALARDRGLPSAVLRPVVRGYAGDLAHDLAAAEEIIEEELQRYLRWRAGRPAAAAVRRMRGGAEAGDGELVRVLAGLFGDVEAQWGLSRKDASGTAPSQQTR